jgi:hypothetical protein
MTPEQRVTVKELRGTRDKRHKEGAFEHDDVVIFRDDTAIPRSVVTEQIGVVQSSDSHGASTMVWVRLTSGHTTLISVPSASLEPLK